MHVSQGSFRKREDGEIVLVTGCSHSAFTVIFLNIETDRSEQTV